MLSRILVIQPTGKALARWHRVDQSRVVQLRALAQKAEANERLGAMLRDKIALGPVRACMDAWHAVLSIRKQRDMKKRASVALTHQSAQTHRRQVWELWKDLWLEEREQRLKF